MSNQYSVQEVLNRAFDDTNNLLKVAEFGTWTPSITFATPGDLSVVYSTQVGRYIKIGRLIVCIFSIQTSTFTHTTASGNLQINTLPYAAASISGLEGETGVLYQGITKANYTHIVAAAPHGGGTGFNLRCSGSGQAADIIDTADMPTGGTVILRGTLVYFSA